MATAILRSSSKSMIGFSKSFSNHVIPILSPTKHLVPAVGAACVSTQSISTNNRRKDELYRQITIEVKGHDPAVLNSYEKFTKMTAAELGVTIGRIFEPPKVLTRLSLLKSVFVHKKHFHQYEARTYYRVFEVKHITGSTASTFLEYIQRNLPEGMAMKVTKHEINALPEHLKPPSAAELPPQSSSRTSTDVDTGLKEATDILTSSEPSSTQSSSDTLPS